MKILKIIGAQFPGGVVLLKSPYMGISRIGTVSPFLRLMDKELREVVLSDNQMVELATEALNASLDGEWMALVNAYAESGRQYSNAIAMKQWKDAALHHMMHLELALRLGVMDKEDMPEGIEQVESLTDDECEIFFNAPKKPMFSKWFGK